MKPVQYTQSEVVTKKSKGSQTEGVLTGVSCLQVMQSLIVISL
ncbi:hypothetical protein L798_14028 [Zootermopsis nevadensis]|uniref:Uncharacterized protein n=1 Tax=Zootermopsis nevadensis TaxID=136037 RepID=A0A067QPK6_ZOONE|nr:hypothetical protein L798_14028 [Zootermopsis nevadensis]